MTILLIHFLADPFGFDFANPIDMAFRTINSENTAVISIDNYSDDITLSGVKEAIGKSEKVVIVCHMKNETVQPGKIRSVISALFAHSDVTLWSNIDHPFLTPFTSKWGLHKYENADDLHILFNKEGED